MKPQINLLSTNDAMVWAEEFVRIKEKNGWTLEDIDEGLMVAWFANAMAAQELAEAKYRKENPADKPCATTAGWAWATACSSLDKGIDMRDVSAPEFWAQAQKDFDDDTIQRHSIRGSW